MEKRETSCIIGGNVNTMENSIIVYVLSCVWLFCDPVDCSPQDSSVHGISRARILQWVTISILKGSSQPRDQTCVSCFTGGSFHHWVTWETQGEQGEIRPIISTARHIPRENNNSKSHMGNFPGGPVVKSLPCNAGDGVHSLVGELRSHMPQSN